MSHGSLHGKAGEVDFGTYQRLIRERDGFATREARSARGRASRSRGAKRELRVRDWYRDHGYEAHKISDSSIVDVIAARVGELLYVEVKSTLTPFSCFPPRERLALLEAAARAGARARLFHWPKGIPITKARIYKPDEWPPC